MLAYYSPRPLPEELDGLMDLALDLRWTWSHASDGLWRMIAPDVWERTRNPWLIMQTVSDHHLEAIARDPEFIEAFRRQVTERKAYLNDPGWFGRTHGDQTVKCIAYFSMEFGLSEALPIYSGGLGILAGDHLKTASDLGVPLVGIGLLYQKGYFRQSLDSNGWQIETYPYNDPGSLPVLPARDASGAWLRVPLELPGRTLYLRVWHAQVGKVSLYLLDSNDPMNSPHDRGITGELYGGGPETRLLQEGVLGIAGWRALTALGIKPDVCHLNEGHSAFLIVEHARHYMEQTGCSFDQALEATRPSHVFTTHTPVAAGFDQFDPHVIEAFAKNYTKKIGVPWKKLLSLGKLNPDDPDEPVNMAYLAVRGSGRINAVSKLHGEVSRRLFHTLFPGLPEGEVPIGYVTNGVHVPSWDSEMADDLWTRACGKERWLGALDSIVESIDNVAEHDLWGMRNEGRRNLVEYARQRLERQLAQRGAEDEAVEEAANVLDPDALTLGIARRFAQYKRPTLIIHDQERLRRILTRADRPVQLVVAGKAHPRDEDGKRLIQAMAHFAFQGDLRERVVFLEDYDMSLAEHLVQGVDVWINTPLRPWEASGTSGMKVLVNGGLNLSELDGWWAEAYRPDVGWALGDGREHFEPEWYEREAQQLYEILEREVIPEFYDRDAGGLPRNWLARIRTSMAQLTPKFSSNRMMREYVEEYYVPAASDLAVNS